MGPNLKDAFAIFFLNASGEYGNHGFLLWAFRFIDKKEVQGPFY